MRIDPEQVVHETVDGEVILIALQTGCYYSLEGSGADVWSGLVDGRQPADVVSELESRYHAGPGEIRSAVLDLVEELMSERLVLADAGEDTPLPEEPASAPGSAGAPFPPPVLRKFTDMQDFLLVDPIHDVDEAGWPHSPAAH